MVAEIVSGRDLVSGKKFSIEEQLVATGTLGAASAIGKLYKGVKVGLGLEESTAGKVSGSVILSMNGAGHSSSFIEDLAEKATKKILGKGKGIEGAGKSIKTQILESPSAKLWGTLKDGTNQGVKHFTDYWDKFPERIPSLATRLGVDESKFENTIQGFENFTEQASRVKNECTASKLDVNGKDIYFLEGAEKAKKGVVVIVKDGKIQSMMPSDPKSFGKME